MKQKLNKLFILLIVAIILAAIGIYLKVLPKYVSRDNLVKKITTSYPVQFCSVIFPHIAVCVSFSAAQCPDIAKPQIESCVAADSTIPNLLTNTEAQKRYESYGKCFSANMHEVILKQYAVQTAECHRILS